MFEPQIKDLWLVPTIPCISRAPSRLSLCVCRQSNRWKPGWGEVLLLASFRGLEKAKECQLNPFLHLPINFKTSNSLARHPLGLRQRRGWGRQLGSWWAVRQDKVLRWAHWAFQVDLISEMAYLYLLQGWLQTLKNVVSRRQKKKNKHKHKSANISRVSKADSTRLGFSLGSDRYKPGWRKSVWRRPYVKREKATFLTQSTKK